MNGQVKMLVGSEFVQNVKVPIGTGKEKRCSKCGEESRHGKSKMCKMCSLSYHRAWRANNPEKVKAAQERHMINNPIRNKILRHDYYLKNKANKLISGQKWNEKNPEKRKAINRRGASKIRSTLSGKINGAIHSGIKKHIRSGTKNGRRWESLTGYSIEQLKSHLEKRFTPEMNWLNYGTYWHIDHIIPVAAFNFETPDDFDFKRCWCLKNLQPLEARENLSKGAKILEPFQFGLGI